MRIAICEDDIVQLNQHKKQLETLCQKYNVAAKISTYETGKAFLFDAEDAENQPDFIVLDIFMPGPNGIFVAESLREIENKKSEILFITHSSEHWKQAFKLKAINYIIKDELDEEEFEQIFLEAKESIERKNTEVITLTCGGTVCNIQIPEISYFEVHRNIMTVHYEKNKTFDFYTTMSNLEEKLEGRGFVRVHNSFLVAKKQIKLFSRTGVELLDGSFLTVGRTYYQKVKALLENEL